MNYAPEHVELALEWIDDLQVLSDAGRRILRRLSLEHLTERQWLSAENIFNDLESVPPHELEVALDDLMIIGVVAVADTDEDEDTFYRVSPQIAFDLDSTIAEVISSEAEFVDSESEVA
jgi:hypothetical protein